MLQIWHLVLASCPLLSFCPPLISLLLVPPGDDTSQDGGPSQSRDPEAMAQARVDIRKLQQFLVGQQVNPSKSMCSKSVSPHLGALLEKRLVMFLRFKIRPQHRNNNTGI